MHSVNNMFHYASFLVIQDYKKFVYEKKLIVDWNDIKWSGDNYVLFILFISKLSVKEKTFHFPFNVQSVIWSIFTSINHAKVY